MRRIDFRIAIAILICHVILGLILFSTGGHRPVTLFSILISAVSLVSLSFWMLRPVRHLEEFARNVIAGTQSETDKAEFQFIGDAIAKLEEQLEQKTIDFAKNQERFEAVLEGMIEGVIAIDDEARILLINRAARSILSIDSPRVIGLPLAGLIRHEAVELAVSEALKTKKTVSTSFQTFENKPHDIRLRVSPMAGTPIPGMTLVFHDVSELVRLEKIRRDFVANVSHELKTPLASIKGFAETLLMGAIDKPSVNRQFVERIDQQSNLLNQQIQDLLQLARIESGRQAFSNEKVDLVQVCQDSIQTFSEEAQRRGVDLQFLNQTGLNGCQILGDSDAMRTIYDNLISNGLRYSQIAGSQIAGRSSPAAVIVRLRTAKEQAIVEIIDNGIGIAKENQQRVFERFFRVDPARSRELGGTGLGLSIVKHLVNSFSGQIELESKLGFGSTFRTTFPLIRPRQ